MRAKAKIFCGIFNHSPVSNCWLSLTRITNSRPRDLPCKKKTMINYGYRQKRVRILLEEIKKNNYDLNLQNYCLKSIVSEICFYSRSL
jgi:hypothetical protein